MLAHVKETRSSRVSLVQVTHTANVSWGGGTGTYADPESYVIGGPTLTSFFCFVAVFFVDEGIEDPNTTIGSGPSSARQ